MSTYVMKITVNPKGEEALYVQIYDAFVAAIASGELKAGDALPSTRRLAGDLGVNYLTVNRAYSLLESEGFVSSSKKRMIVLNPSEKSKSEFIRRWKKTEALMVTEAKAKKVSKSEMVRILREIMKSL